MMKFYRIVFGLLFILIYEKSYACKCARTNIQRDTVKAYDFIIGKVIAEKEVEDNACWASYSYAVKIDFSYREKLSGIQVIKGSKGGGRCGATFEKDKYYLIVVRKCETGYYSFKCSENSLLSEAATQIAFLNHYFHKDYVRDKPEFFLFLITFCLVIVSASGIITFKYYRYRSKRKR